jgi:hypothetical protein
VYRKHGERFTDQCVYETDRFGSGSVMVWAGIWHDGRTQLKIIQGTLNTDVILVQKILTNTSHVTSCIVMLKDVIKVSLLQKGQNDRIKTIVSVYYGIQCSLKTNTWYIRKYVSIPRRIFRYVIMSYVNNYVAVMSLLEFTCR